MRLSSWEQSNNKTFPLFWQEKEREAHEAAANHTKSNPGDECTIRTNPPRAKDADGVMTGGVSRGGSISDACETCSHKATSREALHKMDGKNYLQLHGFKNSD